MFTPKFFTRSFNIVLLVLVIALATFQPGLAAARRPAKLSVTITSPSTGATLRPGTLINVQTSANVVRVEYSIVSTSYIGLTESYLGSSTTRPFSFTWSGYASAVISGGGPYRLMARAYNSANSMVSSEIQVSVSGTWNGALEPAKNTAASPYYEAVLFNGAAWVSHSQNSAVRPLVELNVAGEAAEFTVNAPAAGSYEITFPQYRLTGSKPQFEVRINDLLVAPALPAVQTVTATNDFGREGTTILVADLQAGPNRILVTSLGAGVLSLNAIRIAQP